MQDQRMQFLEWLPQRNIKLAARAPQYTLFQNGHHFSILLFACKLALVASFKVKYFEFSAYERGNKG